jgi:glycosyltransferase involved in cell wall biosynthesis
MTPRFSIILPTHNRAHVPWKAVQSIVAQSMPDWELLVIDDGSTDCTARLLEEFHEPRPRYLHQPRQGPAAARNHGPRLARASFIAYIASDNTWTTDLLATMDAAVTADEAAMLWYCGQRLTIWERTRAGQWAVVRDRPVPRDVRFG